MKPKYQIGDRVAHVLDPEQRGMITGIMLRKQSFCYLVTWKDKLEEKYHYELELTEPGY